MAKSSKAANINCATCDSTSSCVNPFKGNMTSCPQYTVNGQYLGANLSAPVKKPKAAKAAKSSAKSGTKQPKVSIDIKEDHSKDCATCGNGELASKCFACGNNICFKCGRGSKPLIYCEACYAKLPDYLKPVLQILSTVAIAQGIDYIKRALSSESCFTLFSENSNEINLYYHLNLDDAKSFIASKIDEDPEAMLFLCVAYGQKVDIQ